MKKVLLSIIVPAYNAEKSIGKLIESIIFQKFEDYELIIVNDGSTDKTKEVIKNYLKKSDKIVFIDKKNTGVGDTRNVGIKKSIGKYITFADSDDYYTNDLFKKIIPEIKKEDFELLFFNAKVINYGKYVRSQIPEKYEEGYFEDNQGVIKYLKGEFCHRLANAPWNKVYLSRIIKENDLKFEESKKRGQDLIFNILYVSKINKYKYINEELYEYNLNYSQFEDDQYNKKTISNLLEFYEPLKKICIDSNINNYERFLGLFFLRRFPGIVFNEVNNQNKKEGLKNIKEFINNLDIKKIINKAKIIDFDFKLFISYLMYKLRLYKLVFRILCLRKGRKK